MDPVLVYYRELWHQIHYKAAESNYQEERQEYCVWIRNIIKSLDCPVCKVHAIEYLRNNPPELCQNLFIWTWNFHNDVNQRLDKPIVDYMTAVKIYISSI